MAINRALLRAWWVARLQKRRRKLPAPAAPVITDGWVEWDATQVGWADVWLMYTFQHGAFPQANLEMWMAKASGGWVYTLLMTFLSTEIDTFMHASATNTSETFRYKMRYRDDTLFGPFSDVREVVATPP